MKVQELHTKVGDIARDLLQVIRSFNQQDFTTVPIEGSWTAAQVGEHVVNSVSASAK